MKFKVGDRLKWKDRKGHRYTVVKTYDDRMDVQEVGGIKYISRRVENPYDSLEVMEPETVDEFNKMCLKRI